MSDEHGATSSGGFFGNVRQCLTDVRAETRKVTWPQRKEAMAGTIGVVVIVAIISVVLGLIDFGLAKAVSVVMP